MSETKVIKTSRRVLLPSMKIDKFDEIKKHAENLFDCYQNTEDQVPDMICIIRTRRNEDGTFTMYMGASPENDLSELILHEDANINSLTVNRKE